jgi:hypothetical protein
MEGLGFEALKDEAHLKAMTDDVVKSSEIEGEKLPQDEVRSSIARQLGMKHVKDLVPSSRGVDGIVELMTDATTHYEVPLTRRRLFKWHKSLFPTGKSVHATIITGNSATARCRSFLAPSAKKKSTSRPRPPRG